MENLSQNELAELFQQNQTFIDESEQQDIDLSIYHKIIVFTSGGKDSTASVLHLLECGVKPETIELHHHAVDGMSGSELMDWPITESYLEEFSKALDLKLFWSYREGGFEREMLRSDALTAPIYFQDENHNYIKTGGLRGVPNTRLKFPQISGDLRIRWCSPYVKIDVGARMITSQKRFTEPGKKFLVVTAERAEESSNRAKYKVFEPHRTDRRNGKRVVRHVDHWRPVHKWDEYQVWEIMQRWGIQCHPCYHIGFSRCSCLTCIFASKDQWRTIRDIAPERFERIAKYEEQFNTKIHRKLSVREQADLGTSYEADPEMIKLALGSEYDRPIKVDPIDWIMPTGAFKANVGPS